MLLATTSGSSSCSSNSMPGSAVSEEDVEQLEASEMGIQEVSLLQHELKVSAVTVGATGTVGTSGNAEEMSNADNSNIAESARERIATGNVDNSNITQYAREQIASVVMMQAANNRSKADSSNLDAFKQLQYELELGAGPSPKSKVALVLLELFGLGLCGVDRCYMGQCALGLLKGLTAGGFTVWFVFDYLAVIITALSGSEHMNAFGMKGSFITDEMAFAFWLTVIGLFAKCFMGTFKAVSLVSKPLSPTAASSEPKSSTQ